MLGLILQQPGQAQQRSNRVAVGGYMADEQNALAGCQQGDDCIKHKWLTGLRLQGDRQLVVSRRDLVDQGVDAHPLSQTLIVEKLQIRHVT